MADRMDAIILLGAPGAGKGTVAELIQNQTDYRHVSTGDMLRAAVKEGRPVGVEAKSYMERGALVPDEVITKLVTDLMASGDPDARYMLDGFPRTLKQASLLDEAMSVQKATLSHVFLLEASREVLVARLAGRRICRDCGAVYNLVGMTPEKEGICDDCGGALYQRPDDNEETVLNRLEVYEKQTASLIAYYEEKQLLRRVDGAVGKEVTSGEIVEILAASESPA